MRPLKIFVWSCIWILCIFVGVLAYHYLIPLSWIPQNSWEYRLADFDRRLLLYELSRSPQNVMVGCSYVAQLGEVATFQNLGLGTTSAVEHKRLIEAYARPADTVYYVCSVADAIRYPFSREEISNSFLRYRLALKTILCAGHGMDILGGIPKTREEIIASQINELQNAQLQPIWKWFTGRPNFVFVLSPIYDPRHPKAIVFREAVCQSGQPVVDFSATVPPQYFLDFVHMDAKGKQLFKNALVARSQP